MSVAAFASPLNLSLIKCLHDLMPREVETSKVTLRLTQSSDEQKLLEIMQIPEVAKGFGEVSAEKYADRGALSNTRVEYTVLLGGQIIGLVQASSFSNENSTYPFLSKNENWTTIGYAMHPQFWGQGIATEVVEQFLILLDVTIDPAYYFVTVGADNPASAKVLKRNGFVEFLKKSDGSVDYVRRKDRNDLMLRYYWKLLIDWFKRR